MDNSLTEVVNSVIVNSLNKDQMVPTWVANEAYSILDPDKESPARVRLGCTEHLKQLARQRLRHMLEPETAEEIEQQGTLWELQTHYPQARKDSDNESVYVRRERLTWDDIVFNHNRMDNAGDTLKAHAKRLLQYGIDRGLQQSAAQAA